MKKTPPTSTLAGIVGGSSEASAARRDVLRVIAASVVSAVPNAKPYRLGDECRLARFEPEFIAFQCGADGLRGDPLAHLNYTSAAHAHAAQSLLDIAMHFSGGRLMAFGGGGYGRNNPAKAWSAVLNAMVARKTSASKTQTDAQ